ncbi:MAG TPA: BBP7 family outer membrane beta-barrel protein, partial [Urbifossiella sp.]|nr:BBP7 family outer membrane beta-barrel protein [Urbifossiella sp.]
MRAGWFAIAGTLLLGVAGRGAAQPTAPATKAIPPASLPSLPTSGEQPLPGGADVSQPLQPVDLTAQPPTPNPANSNTVEISINPTQPKKADVLGNWWNSDELLIWWPKYQPLPPLVTGSRGAAPLLGLPTTSLLIGNHTINAQDIEGYRLVQGWSLNEEDTLGFEGRYFFLGTRTLSQSVTDLGNDRVRAIGLPYINALTGQEDALPLARPGLSSAMTTVSITDRLQGAEANFLGNLIAEENFKLHAIAGYRFFQVNEGLRIESQWL